MATTKFEVNIYDGRRDFNMWSKKMRAILMQLKCAWALDQLSASKRTKLEKIARITIFLYLSNNVIKCIGEIKTAEEL